MFNNSQYVQGIGAIQFIFVPVITMHFVYFYLKKIKFYFSTYFKYSLITYCMEIVFGGKLKLNIMRTLLRAMTASVSRKCDVFR